MAAAPSHRTENLSLVARYQQGDRESAEELLKANAGLIGSAVRHYAPRARSLEPDDLFIAGQLGLLNAARKFDGSRGLQFSTYATLWIRQAISRAIANTDAMIRLPTHCRRDGALPTCEVSLDALVAAGEDTRLGDLLAAGDDVEGLAVQRLQAAEILAGLARLTERERTVLLARAEGQTLSATARLVGMSREGVRHLERRARGKVAAALVSDSAGETDRAYHSLRVTR